MEKLKQFIVGTKLGDILKSTRDTFNLVYKACFCIDQVGAYGNGIVANQLITKFCDSNKCFIDIGSHIGSIISDVIRNDSSIKIIAIEPMHEKVINLRNKFPSVKVYECAAGAQECEAPFFINTKRTGYSTMFRPAHTPESDLTEIKVNVKRLDDLVSGDDVDAIKMDVEGAELEVLRGSINLLQRNRPLIMFESGLSISNELNHKKEALWQLMADLSYSVHIPNRVAHNDPGLSQEGFVESHIYPYRTINYFAIPKERRIQIRDRARSILKISDG